MRNSLFFIFTGVALLLLITGCNQQLDINVGEALVKTQEQLRILDEIGTTAAAFDGKSEVKFRLMVEEEPTKEEAIILFNKIVDSFQNTSNHAKVWDYYNGYFDIKSYETGAVIYQATNLISEELKVEKTFFIE
jgi:hypothetical protein